MGMLVNLPEMDIKEDEVKLLLAIKLLDESFVSLGKAAEINTTNAIDAFRYTIYIYPLTRSIVASRNRPDRQ